MLVPTLAFALLVVAQAAPADPAERGAPEVPDVIGALGPTTSAPVTVGTTRYLPLASGGVAIVDVTDAAAPRVVGRMLEGRVVSRLVLVDGQLMAIVVQQEALTFSLADPLAPVAALPLLPGAPRSPEPATPAPVTPAPVTPEPAPRTLEVAKARVVEVTGGRVIFDGGTIAGFTKGSRVRIVSQQLVDKPDLAGSGTTQVASGEVTAVVAVEEAEPGRAMAKLGRGDVAFPGDLVELAPTSELSERLFLPRRAPFTVRAGFHARPFLGLGSTSVGFLIDGYATYYFEAVPISLTVELAPIGFALGSQDAHYPMTGAVLASYTTDFFEIGIGGGALLGNPGPCFQTFDPNTGLITGGVTCEVNTGPTINQALRLGSVDGLHIAWSSSIFVRSPEGFVFGMGRAELGVPVSSTLGLFAAGGGGENGWGFGEVGVRSFFGGTGAPGTVMLSASLGGAGVFDGPNHENVIGPSVAFGMEWRL